MYMTFLDIYLDREKYHKAYKWLLKNSRYNLKKNTIPNLLLLSYSHNFDRTMVDDCIVTI